MPHCLWYGRAANVSLAERYANSGKRLYLFCHSSQALCLFLKHFALTVSSTGIKQGREIIITYTSLFFPVKNREVAGLLYEMAELLELHAENRFKIIAYSKAARAIESLQEDI